MPTIFVLISLLIYNNYNHNDSTHHADGVTPNVTLDEYSKLYVKSALLSNNDFKTYRLHDSVRKKQAIWNTRRFDFRCRPSGNHYSGLPGSVLFDGPVIANGVGRWNTVAINQTCAGRDAFVCPRAEIGKFTRFSDIF